MQRRTFLGAIAGFFGFSVIKIPERRVHRARPQLKKVKLGDIVTNYAPAFIYGPCLDWPSTRLASEPGKILVTQPNEKGKHRIIIGHARLDILLLREGPEYEIEVAVSVLGYNEWIARRHSFHASFNVHGAVTSRFSSKEPKFG